MSVTLRSYCRGDISYLGSATPAPEVLANTWATNLKNSVAKNNTNRPAVIGSAADFVDKMALPAGQSYAGILNTAGQTKREKPLSVSLAQYNQKLKTSYDKWLSGINNMFGPDAQGVVGGNYIKAVTAKQDNWLANFEAYIFPTVGSKNSGKGPVVFIPLYFLGDPGAAAVIPAGWTHSNISNCYIKAGAKQSFKAGLTGALIQLFQWAIVSGFDPATMAIANQRIVTIMNGYLDPAQANQMAAPDATPNSSFILSQGATPDTLHIDIEMRVGTP